jgi:hypothetical protein
LASGGGTIASDGGSPVIQRGVCWSIAPNPTIANNFTSNGTGIGSYTSTITPLLPSTTYYVRAYATNANGTSYGNQVVFTTSVASAGGNLPTITTSPIVYLDSLSAFSGGNITADGGLAVTARGVCWAIGTTPTINNSHTIDGAGGGSFNSRVFNLLPNTSYFVRAYATNAAGTVYGITFSFTTKGFATVKTDSVSTIYASDAKVHGNVISDGGSAVSERGICWSTSPNPTIANNKVAPFLSIYSLSGIGAYYSLVTSLPANTTIYFKAYAGNGIGYAYGNELVATTKNGIPTIIADSVTNIRVIEATISSRIIDDGGSQIIKRGVCWSTVPNPNINDSITSDGGSPNGLFLSIPKTLLPNTTYYIRAYASTSIGTGYSNQLSFKTKDGIPVINLDSIFNVRVFDAKSSFRIVYNGGGDIIEKGICWKTSINPTINDIYIQNLDTSSILYSQIINLLSDTIYFLRAYAKTNSGVFYSNQISFRTRVNNGFFFCTDTQTIVQDVINSLTGKTWMDRNLGALRSANNSTDSISFGDLYQWGRKNDGHQCRNSTTTNIISSSISPIHGSFILTGNLNDNWNSSSNYNLWQGVNGVNNPCPQNYRLPTKAELQNETSTWNSLDHIGAFNSVLKLPLTGNRSNFGGIIGFSGQIARYWTSTLNNSLRFESGFLFFDSNSDPSRGFAIRCIKN